MKSEISHVTHVATAKQMRLAREITNNRRSSAHTISVRISDDLKIVHWYYQDLGISPIAPLGLYTKLSATIESLVK